MSPYQKWRARFLERERYSQPSREPFFRLAEAYLPSATEAIVLDVGAGDGAFARAVELIRRYPNARLLERAETSLAPLRAEFGDAVIAYEAPDALPFPDGSVAFIHLSHIVEHLSPADLYAFLTTCDRVLAPKGRLVISAPMLWDRFYDDMSHVKPYNPAVFLNYLSAGRENASADIISRSYRLVRLVYRYRIETDPRSILGSRFFIMDSALRLVGILFAKFGFRRYTKNGFTLVLEKTA